MLHYGQASREECELKRLAALIADNTALPLSPDGSTPELSAITPIPVLTPQEPVHGWRSIRETLRAEHGIMAAGIRVDGTGIDYPVM